MTPETTRPLLLIVSDRPHVWVGYRSPDREVRRWVGERDSDEERAAATNFTGDPTDPETYRWALASRDLSAVVDLHDDERARGAIDALRRIRPEAAVLVITANDDVDAGEIEVSRRLAWTDALRGDLEAELRQLEAKRRLHELRKFAEGDGDVPILLHPDPDPDALASALALRALLRRDPDSTPVITTGDMTRAENRRMAELLRMRVTRVTQDEVQRLARVIAVDFQPHFDMAEDTPRLAIIDHHPVDEQPAAEFRDVRPEYGATATMMTEYLLLEDARRIAEPLATALLYGIKTDTDSLSRGTIPADVQAYALLQGRADLALLRRLERPSYTMETARNYGTALTNLHRDDELAVAYMGRLDERDRHALTDVADFCLGLNEVTWAAAAAEIDGYIALAIRHLGGSDGAGKLARRLAARGGSGGGHATMARALVPVCDEWAELPRLDAAAASVRLAELVRAQIEELGVNRRSSHQARPATIPSSANK